MITLGTAGSRAQTVRELKSLYPRWVTECRRAPVLRLGPRRRGKPDTGGAGGWWVNE